MRRFPLLLVVVLLQNGVSVEMAGGWTSPCPILPGSQDRLAGRVTLDGNGRAHVTWHERVGGYFQAWHTDNTAGAFAAPTMISQGGSIHCYGPAPALNGPDLHVVWTSDQTANNNFEIWYRRKTAGAWGPIVNASNTSIKSLGQAVAVRDDVGPAVAWQEAIYADDNYDVFFSEWSGSGFTPAVNLSNTPGGRVYGSVAPALAVAANGDITVVWPERITGDYHMNARRRVGGVWGPRAEISTKPTGPGAAGITVAPDGQVHIAYTAGNVPDDGVNIVWYQKWNGSAWTPPFDLSRGVQNLLRPSIAVDDDGFAHVAADNAQGNPQGQIWYTTNRSGAWSPWTNISSTPTRSSSPVIACGGGQLMAIWSDDGNGPGGASGFANIWHTRAGLSPIGPSGLVKGTVFDQNGAGVAGATISAGLYQTVSAVEGRYELRLPVGRLDIACNKAFYTGRTITGLDIADNVTITVDFSIVANTPNAAMSFTVDQGNETNTLAWMNPNNGWFSGTRICFGTAAAPAGPRDGTVLVDLPGSPGGAGAWQHVGLTNGQPYHYAAFAYFEDASKHFAMTAAIASGTPAGPGDLDRDGDVDQADFGPFQACLSGAFIPQPDPACRYAHLDADADVDLDDVGIFIGCMSDPGIPSDARCAD